LIFGIFFTIPRKLWGFVQDLGRQCKIGLRSVRVCDN
jgi:hypothetical protein